MQYESHLYLKRIICFILPLYNFFATTTLIRTPHLSTAQKGPSGLCSLFPIPTFLLAAFVLCPPVPPPSPRQPLSCSQLLQHYLQHGDFINELLRNVEPA